MDVIKEFFVDEVLYLSVQHDNDTNEDSDVNIYSGATIVSTNLSNVTALSTTLEDRGTAYNLNIETGNNIDMSYMINAEIFDYFVAQLKVKTDYRSWMDFE